MVWVVAQFSAPPSLETLCCGVLCALCAAITLSSPALLYLGFCVPIINITGDINCSYEMLLLMQR